MTSTSANKLCNMKNENIGNVLCFGRKIVNVTCVLAPEMIREIMSTKGGRPIPLSALIGLEKEDSEIFEDFYINRTKYLCVPKENKSDEEDELLFNLHGMDISDCTTISDYQVPINVAFAMQSIDKTDADVFSEVYHYNDDSRYRKILNHFNEDGKPIEEFYSQGGVFQAKVKFDKRGTSSAKLVWESMEPMPRLHVDHVEFNDMKDGIGHPMKGIDMESDHFNYKDGKKLITPIHMAHVPYANTSSFHNGTFPKVVNSMHNGNLTEFVQIPKGHYFDNTETNMWTKEQYGGRIYTLCHHWYSHRSVSLRSAAIWFCIDEAFTSVENDWNEDKPLTFTLRMDISIFRNHKDKNFQKIGRCNYIQDHINTLLLE